MVAYVFFLRSHWMLLIHGLSCARATAPPPTHTHEPLRRDHNDRHDCHSCRRRCDWIRYDSVEHAFRSHCEAAGATVERVQLPMPVQAVEDVLSPCVAPPHQLINAVGSRAVTFSAAHTRACTVRCQTKISVSVWVLSYCLDRCLSSWRIFTPCMWFHSMYVVRNQESAHPSSHHRLPVLTLALSINHTPLCLSYCCQGTVMHLQQQHVEVRESAWSLSITLFQ
jgi:hypothetical protein